MDKRFYYSIITIFLIFLVFMSLSRFNNSVSNSGSMILYQAFPNLTFSQPVDFQTDKSTDNLVFVVEQQGIIKIFVNSPLTENSNTFLDIRSKLLSGGERGLLGLAFHQNFSSNGLFYVDYTAKPDGRTVVAEYKYENSSVDVNSERIIFEQTQPFANHNAGQILFGLDGFLYITLGDGGSGGDPYGNAQNLSTNLGSILRINVDQSSNGKNYSIPNDNPFVKNNLGYKEEIFAYGLRNPWRISQDSVTGTLWVGDVGQNSYEEVNIIEKGHNYGWNFMEGFSCYNPSSNCDKTNLTEPVFSYGRNEGYAVTGGYVYRGAIDSLYGKYIFGDYGTGKIWSIDENHSTSLILDSSLTISSFGIDSQGEIFVLDYNSGSIYKFNNSFASLNNNSSSIISSSEVHKSIPGYDFIFVTSGLIFLYKRKNIR